MYCEYCGRKLTTEKFCPGCGNRVVHDDVVIPAQPAKSKQQKSAKENREKKPKASKKRRAVIWLLIAIGLLMSLLIGAVIYFFVLRDREEPEPEGEVSGEEAEEPEEEVKPFELDVSTHAIELGSEDALVVFRAVLKEEADSVRLYDSGSNTFLVELLDDGAGYDEEAGDLIYTAALMLETDHEYSTTYMAKTDDNHSDKEIVNILAPLTDAELDDISVVDAAVEGLKDYFDEFDDLTYEEKKAAVTEVLNALAAEGLIDGDSILLDDNLQTATFYYASGIIGVIDMREHRETDNPMAVTGGAGGSGSEAEEVSFDSQMVQDESQEPVDIKLLYAWFEPGDDSYTGTHDTLNGLRSIFSAYGFRVVQDDEVTVEDLKQLSDDELVYVAAHGIYTRFQYISDEKYFFFFDKKETITTSGFGLLEEATQAKDQQYNLDLKSGRIIKWGTEYMILPAFFDEHYSRKDFLDTMFVFGSCELMGKDGIMHRAWPDVLSRKSAKATVAFHNSVYIYYGYELLHTMVDELSEGRTISEALETAKTTHGADDVVWGSNMNFDEVHSPAAYPVLSGDHDARLISIIGSIRGKVADAVTRSPIQTAALSLRPADGIEVLQRQTTDESGNFSFSLEEGTYDLIISADGYMNCIIRSVPVEKGFTNYLQNTILLNRVEGDPAAYVSGTVTDAVTDEKVTGATIRFRENWGNRTGPYMQNNGMDIVLVSDGSGNYFTDKLAYGYYTLEISYENYATQYVNVIASNDPAAYEHQDIVLVPVAHGNDFRITLEWDANPRDEDSHIVSDSPYSYHVYYADQSHYAGGELIANLDHDDVNGYGFETVTLTVDPEGTYYYYVHHYAGTGSLSTSNAIVKVYQGDVMIRQYNVPVDQGTGIYWNVFNIVNGRVVTINRISDSPSTD